VPVYKLTLEYCGAEFYGWAAQPDQRTVEAVVTHALEVVLSERPKLSVAGRTDTGVHARAQVASFESQREADPFALTGSLNGLLSHDVAALAAERMVGDFDARGDALSRTYCYRILPRMTPSPFEREWALWLPQAIDRAVLDRCAAALTGKHDFTAFTPTQTDHVRFNRDVFRAEWRDAGDILEFWIEADTFMRHMVRTLVGTMLDVATGRTAVSDFVRLLDGAPRSSAGPTADPRGLYLESVRY
jgi:tRNA pseudouridine38-40 synthase